MRILYLVPPAREPGMKLGRYSFLHEEVLALAASGVEVFVLSRFDQAGHPAGVHVRTFSDEKSAGDVRTAVPLLSRHWRHAPVRSALQTRTFLHALAVEARVADVVRADRIDVIHSHFGWPKGLGGLLASKETGVPLIASFHGGDILLDPAIGYGHRRDIFFDRAVMRLLKGADRTLYYSDFMRRHGIAIGAEASATRVIPWGIDVDAFRVGQDPRAARNHLGLPERPTFLAVGGLIERKGIDFLLRALEQLRRTHDFSLIVCGEGPELESLQRLSHACGLGDRTRFAGRVGRDVVPHYFAAADVFVHGAVHEAAGLVLIEAMASGRPVVCTDAGGPAEYVEDGVTGFVVPRDAAQMASKLRMLLDDPAQREALGRRGRERALARFSRSRMTRELIAEYEDLARCGSEVGAR